MQGIEFEEDKDYRGLKVKTLATPLKKQSLMMGILEKAGVADKSTANLILLGIAAFFFGITIFLYAGILGDSANSVLSSEQLATQQRVMKEMLGIK